MSIRDFSTIVSIYGKTAVSLSTWRNDNRTAFASVTIGNPWNTSLVTREAKSQGPSSGGFNKPAQALARLSALFPEADKALAVLFPAAVPPRLYDYQQSAESWAQMLAQAMEHIRKNGAP